MGNYNAFGDTKFIPQCSKEVFYKILGSAPQTENSNYLKYFDMIWPQVEKEIFEIEGVYKQLNKPT